MVCSAGDDVELNVDDVFSVEDVPEVGVDGETDDVCVLSSIDEDDELTVVDVIPVVGVTVVELDVDEEPSSPGEDDELNVVELL